METGCDYLDWIYPTLDKEGSVTGYYGHCKDILVS